MNRGVLIFAHNNRDIDYALMSIISGGLAKKNLGVPVSLVTDPTTVNWLIESKQFEKAATVFDKIISVDKPETDNKRKLHDGLNNKVVPFVNSNRCSAWDLTPYDKTLIIDSDFFIFSDRLSQFWDLDFDVMIGNSALDIVNDSRLGYHDRYVSDTGIHMNWATTVMFEKNENSKIFFNTVDLVKEKYKFYGDIFRFSTDQFRNDIAFSVAKHILQGFETENISDLPPILTTLDRDILHSVTPDGKLFFLVSPNLGDKFCISSIKDMDVHIMNKQSIIRNADSLLELI
jgi:hypothetical protein